LPAGGCTFAIDPGLDCIHAAPIWAASIDPYVISARIFLSSNQDVRSRWDRLIRSSVERNDVIHARLELPDGPLRLDVIGEHWPFPVGIEPAIDLRRALAPQMCTGFRLAHWIRGDLALQTRDSELERWVTALRVSDALDGGASQREIGLGIYGGDWPGDGEHLKSRVRRLITMARKLLSTGPRGILSAPNASIRLTEIKDGRLA
jgi:hypothetical protein